MWAFKRKVKKYRDEIRMTVIQLCPESWEKMDKCDITGIPVMFARKNHPTHTEILLYPKARDDIQITIENKFTESEPGEVTPIQD